jgi:hypothetical protein
MEWTYDNIKKWFDAYFEDVCVSQGDLETVTNLKKYFSSDLELLMYTAPSSPPVRLMSRDDLLISFVHPGLQEDIVPLHFAIDANQMIVAIQFEIRFTDKPSGKKWEPDEKRDLKIRRIFYWTEALPKDLFDYWTHHRENALRQHALNYLNSES